MEVDMEGIMELAFLGGGDLWCRDWSPAIDWGHFPVDDDFHGLLGYYGLPCTPVLQDWSTSVSATSTNSPGTPLDELPPAQAGMNSPVSDDEQGLRLVHLLMAAAEALTGADKSRYLANVILVRLRELLAGGGASSMERLAEHFTDALQGVLDGCRRQHEEPPHQPSDALEAFQMLQDMSPYVKFGHFTANQAILEAVSGERRVHIVDYEVMEGVQWASMMQALVSRQDGAPPPLHFRITAVTRFGGGRRSASTVLETGRRLSTFAASIGLPFTFGHCRLDGDDKFRPEAVKLVKGEAVVFNCALHPPHLPPHSSASVSSFLAGAGALGARLVTVVEETATASGGNGGGNFVGLFMEELRRYSAMWDSLEAGFPKHGKSRGVVERMILGPMIAGAVRRAYLRQEEGEEKREGWAEWMEAAGFSKVGLSFFNLCQSRLLLGLFNDGYRVEEETPNKLVFCWKTCRLLSASVWSARAMGLPAAISFSS